MRRAIRSGLRPLTAATLLALALAAPASAVVDVIRPADDLDGDFAAPYLHYGPALVHPVLAIGETYSDNVYATATDTVSDWHATVDLGLSVELPMDTQQLILGAAAQIARYHEHSELDWDDTKLFGRWAFVLGERLFVEAGDVYTSGHLTPLESTSGQAESYATNEARLALRYEIADLWQARLGYTLTAYDYDESGYRSRDEDHLELAVSFRAFPRTTLFAGFDAAWVDYDDPTDTLDNTETGFSLGATWEITELTRGTVEAGTRAVDFDDPAEGDWSTWGGSIDLLQELTGRTTLLLRGERSIEEGKYPGTRYVSSTGLGAELTTRFSDRLSGTVAGGYYWEDFSDPNPGDTALREDRTARLGLGLRYAPRGWLLASLEYGYLDRDSDIDHYDARENTLTVQVAARF